MPEFIQAWDLDFLWWLRSFRDPLVVTTAFLLSTISWKGWLWWLIIGTSWIRGKRDFAARVAISLTIAVVAGLPLKSVIARPRPDLYASQQLGVPMPELLLTTHSFPSGHALLSATFAFIVYRHCNKYWAALCFAFVVAIGLARIHGGYHWPTDIVFSVLLGAFCAWAGEKICDQPFITRFTRPKEKPLITPKERATTEPERELVKR